MFASAGADSEFEASAPTTSTDRICIPCTTCNPGTYGATACTTTDDTICKPHSSCAGSESDRIRLLVPGKADRNSVCAKCSRCSNLEYEMKLCSDGDDTTCAPLTPACDRDAGFYEAKKPTLTGDRVCDSCSPCQDGMYMASDCTKTKDRVCLPTASCSSVVVTKSFADTIVSSHGGILGKVSGTNMFGSPLSPSPTFLNVTGDGSAFASIRLNTLFFKKGDKLTASLRAARCSNVVWDSISAPAYDTIPRSFILDCTKSKCEGGSNPSKDQLWRFDPAEITTRLVTGLSLVVESNKGDGNPVFCADLEATSLPAPEPGSCTTGCPFGTVFSPTGCKQCQTCPEGQHQIDGCDGSATDTLCANDLVCKVDEYRASGGAECRPCSECGDGTYLTQPCSTDTDTICTPWSECAESEFESVFGTAVDDRSCLKCRDCGKGFYQVAPCSSAADTKCKKVRTCSATEWQVAAPTATSNRKCKSCTTCPDTPFEACSTENDASCSALTLQAQLDLAPCLDLESAEDCERQRDNGNCGRPGPTEDVSVLAIRDSCRSTCGSCGNLSAPIRPRGFETSNEVRAAVRKALSDQRIVSSDRTNFVIVIETGGLDVDSTIAGSADWTALDITLVFSGSASDITALQNELNNGQMNVYGADDSTKENPVKLRSTDIMRTPFVQTSMQIPSSSSSAIGTGGIIGFVLLGLGILGLVVYIQRRNQDQQGDRQGLHTNSSYETSHVVNETMYEEPVMASRQKSVRNGQTVEVGTFDAPDNIGDANNTDTTGLSGTWAASITGQPTSPEEEIRTRTSIADDMLPAEIARQEIVEKEGILQSAEEARLRAEVEEDLRQEEARVAAEMEAVKAKLKAQADAEHNEREKRRLSKVRLGSKNVDSEMEGRKQRIDAIRHAQDMASSFINQEGIKDVSNKVVHGGIALNSRAEQEQGISREFEFSVLSNRQVKPMDVFKAEQEIIALNAEAATEREAVIRVRNELRDSRERKAAEDRAWATAQAIAQKKLAEETKIAEAETKANALAAAKAMEHAAKMKQIDDANREQREAEAAAREAVRAARQRQEKERRAEVERAYAEQQAALREKAAEDAALRINCTSMLDCECAGCEADRAAEILVTAGQRTKHRREQALNEAEAAARYESFISIEGASNVAVVTEGKSSPDSGEEEEYGWGASIDAENPGEYGFPEGFGVSSSEEEEEE